MEAGGGKEGSQSAIRAIVEKRKAVKEAQKGKVSKAAQLPHTSDQTLAPKKQVVEGPGTIAVQSNLFRRKEALKTSNR